MNQLGHLERAERFISRPRLTRGSDGTLGWRSDYRSRGPKLVNDAAYGQYADLGVKASATGMSIMLLLKSDTPTEKVVFAVSSVLLSVITLASAFETF